MSANLIKICSAVVVFFTHQYTSTTYRLWIIATAYNNNVIMANIVINDSNKSSNNSNSSCVNLKKNIGHKIVFVVKAIYYLLIALFATGGQDQTIMLHSLQPEIEGKFAVAIF